MKKKSHNASQIPGRKNNWQWHAMHLRTAQDKLAAIKVIECRDVDYETAKKEVAGYFQMKGAAYASDASIDLQLDYELVCKIMDDGNWRQDGVH
jgi:hypothetical protein